MTLILAEVTYLTYLAISIALSATTALIAARKAGRRQQVPDEQLTTLASRGDYVPMAFGRFRTGPLFAWVGARVPKTGKRVDGKGATKNARETVFWQNGWHILSIMPLAGLYEIYDGAKLIWSGDITPANTPSGSTVSTAADGSFRIYWGEDGQPVDPVLSKELESDSFYPYTCYIVWEPKNNGTNAVWGQIEYVYETGCSGNALADSSYVLESGLTRGINPAHILYQVLTAPGPYGADIPVDLIDQTSLEAFGVLCESEFLPANFLISGQSVKDVLEMIAEDCGIMYVQIGRRLTFVPLREEEDAPVLTEDHLETTSPEVEVFDTTQGSKPIAYFFKDPDINYRNSDAGRFHDGTADQRSVVQPQQRNINIFTSRDISYGVAERRARAELSQPESIRPKVFRDAVNLSPGRVFTHPSLGQLRAISRKRLPGGTTAQLTAIPDIYSESAGSFIVADGILGYEPLDVAHDLAVAVGIDPQGYLIVFRIRAHDQVAGAFVHLSADGGTSYDNIGTQDYPASGGDLLTGWTLDPVWQDNENLLDGDYRRPTGAATGLRYRYDTDGQTAASEPNWPDVIGGSESDGDGNWIAEAWADGPEFEPLNDDDDWEDYTADESSWLAGKQLMLIDSEIFYVRSVELLSESAYATSTAYTADDAVMPSEATGLRYTADNTGTSSGTEPTWPTVAGETVVDNDITWTAHRFRYQSHGLIVAREGTDSAAHSIGATAFITAKSSLKQLSDPTIQAGASLRVKTQPLTTSQTAPLSTATETVLSVP